MLLWMSLYKELFICFEISLRQSPKSEIYEAQDIFMVLNIVPPNCLQGHLAMLLSFPFSKLQLSHRPPWGVQPAAHGLHAAQDGCECGPTQNHKFT